MPKRPYVPTPRELGRLAWLSLDNAVELLDDARVLLDAERIPRALALGTLAAEEFGKYFLSTVAIGTDPDDLDAWRLFWQRFKNHKPKLTHWQGQFIDMIAADDLNHWEQLWAELTSLTQTGLDLKMPCLYVDLRDGTITYPGDGLSRKLVNDLIASVALVVDSTASLSAGVDLEKHFERTAAQRRDLLDRMIKAKAGSETDRQALLTYMHEQFGLPLPPVDQAGPAESSETPSGQDDDPQGPAK